jgi:threonylcarbamoyladenosine tRNA methylthiotransferase MtaB
MEIRKRRTHVLRDLAASKNRAFRTSMVGRIISAVTIASNNDGRMALSSNYLKIEMAAPHEPNRIIDVRIGGLTAEGLSEAGSLRVL